MNTVNFSFKQLSTIFTFPYFLFPQKVNDERIKPLSRGTGEGFAYANFKPQKFSYLNVTSIGSDYVREDSECGFVCANTPSCFSFNLGVFSAFMGKVLCELLPSDVFNNSDKFVYSQSHHHYSITVRNLLKCSLLNHKLNKTKPKKTRTKLGLQQKIFCISFLQGLLSQVKHYPALLQLCKIYNLKLNTDF